MVSPGAGVGLALRYARSGRSRTTPPRPRLAAPQAPSVPHRTSPPEPRSALFALRPIHPHAVALAPVTATSCRTYIGSYTGPEKGQISLSDQLASAPTLSVAIVSCTKITPADERIFDGNSAAARPLVISRL